FLDTAHKNFPNKPIFVSEFGQRADGINVSGKLDDEYKTQQARDQYLRDMIAAVRARPFVIGASLWTFNDYRSRYPGTNANGYRWWGMIDHNRQPRSAYHAMREEFSPVVITQIVADTVNTPQGITIHMQVGLMCRKDFPSYTLRGYELRYELLDAADQPLDRKGTLKLEPLKPGANPGYGFSINVTEKQARTKVRIQIVRPTGFVVAERTKEITPDAAQR
ncbi:MAG: hypothetical protein M3R15_19420, partial [Acidobacteriota bacterium]|nr:hypothetical protein [Acidobacteriota bacterium]